MPRSSQLGSLNATTNPSTNIQSFVDDYWYECLPPLETEEQKPKENGKKKSSKAKHETEDTNSSMSLVARSKLSDQDLMQLLEKMPRKYASNESSSKKKKGQTLAETVEDLVRVDAIQRELATRYKFMGSEVFLTTDAESNRRATIENFSFNFHRERT
jgi:hypothetical protein